jgi:peptide-methionine (S)-S-oxide reductase
MMSFVLGGGCFWCLDAAYRVLTGVSDVVSGYCGGQTDNPNYEQVCSGQTGHAEVVRVEFDDAVIPAAVILDAFFTMHDPRQLNRQGNDVGTQYRSAMFYVDDAQRVMFDEARARAEDTWGGGVVTTIEPLGVFFDAEDYHQNYYVTHPYQGYCMGVVAPKLDKFRKHFAQLKKKSD